MSDSSDPLGATPLPPAPGPTVNPPMERLEYIRAVGVEEVEPDESVIKPSPFTFDLDLASAIEKSRRKHWTNGANVVSSTQYPGDGWTEITVQELDQRIAAFNDSIEQDRLEFIAAEAAKSPWDRIADLVGVKKSDLIAEMVDALRSDHGIHVEIANQQSSETTASSFD
jgi:hypothetical protein